MERSFFRQFKIISRLSLFLILALQNVQPQSKNLLVVKNGNLREGPGTDTRVIAKLSPQQTLTILDKSGDWYFVQTHPNQCGWVNTILVTPTTAHESDSLSEDKLKVIQHQWSQEVSQKDRAEITWEKMTTRQAGKLYSEPGYKNEPLENLPAGICVHKLDTDGKWFYIRTEDNHFGWVNQDIFKTAKVTQTTPVKNPVTLTKNGNLRQNPTTSSAKIKLVPAGTTVDLLDSTTDWRQVRTPDQTIGWLNMIVFQKTRIAEPVKIIRKASVARDGNVRQKPDLKADIIAKVRDGQTVNILQESGDWNKISLTENQTGWIHKILFEKPKVKPIEEVQISTKSAPALTKQPEDKPVRETPSLMPDTTQTAQFFSDELSSAEEYHAKREIVKAVDNYFSAETKLTKSVTAAPKNLCLKYRLAKSRYALAHSLYAKEDPTISEAMTDVRNAAFSNVNCADEARKTLDLWEGALRLRSQILSIFSLDSVNLSKITKSLAIAPGQFPILYEAEAKYLIGRYYFSRLNDPSTATVWLDESVSLFKAYDRNRSIKPDSNLENYFKACLDLGAAYAQIAKFGESSSAFNLAYQIARRTNNQEWLQYYQKRIRSITDRLD